MIGASLAATGTRSPLRTATEPTEAASVRDGISEPVVIAAMLAEEPTGPQRLCVLAGAEPEMV